MPLGPRGVGVIFALTLLSAAAPPLSAQLSYGGHFARAQEAFGGTTGFGIRAGIGLPLFPIELFAGGEYYFPRCASFGGCALSGLSVDANWRLPFPILSPYATGGWVIRRLDPGAAGEAYTRSGPHVGLGISGGAPGARLFGEGRYEFVETPKRQIVFRVGVLLSR